MKNYRTLADSEFNVGYSIARRNYDNAHRWDLVILVLFVVFLIALAVGIFL